MNRLGNILNKSQISASTGVRVVSILSGKGGVGKSVVAFNLAERAAAAGLKTILVDADIYCGNLHILANIIPSGGLDAFVKEQKSLSEAITRYNENLDILARSETGPLEQLASAMDVARCVDRLRQAASAYDLVIIDHSSGISDTATVFANASDMNLLLLVPELTSISDCYGLCKYLYQANQSVDCRLLINRVESDDEADHIWTKFAAMAEQFLGRVPSLAGTLPEDKAVRQSIASQRPIIEISPKSLVAQALAGIVRNLMAELSPTTVSNSTLEINSVTATAEVRE